MLLTISSKVFGSTNPATASAKEEVTNGDFTIKSNVDRPDLTTGDGVDEGTTWSFDMTDDPKWSDFSTDESILNAKLVLTLTPKNRLISTDLVSIQGLAGIATPIIQSLPVGRTATVELDLLALGYSSSDINTILEDNAGRIPMLYADDAIVSYAELVITQKYKEDCRLIVEAVSEDTIADPGDSDRNYVLISVSDTCGQPVTHLTEGNFAIDAMIVGPGGSLVEITRLIHSSRMDGFYFMDIVPIAGRTWKAGVYVFSIEVKDGDRRGQTLTKVKLD